MTLYKGASVCNSNLNKEAILLAKGTRINPFPLPQHAPHHWSSRECGMLTIDRRLQDQPNQQEPHQGLTRKVGSQHFAEHIGGSKTVKPLMQSFPNTISTAKCKIIYQQLKMQKWGSSWSQNRHPGKRVALTTEKNISRAKAGQACSCFSDVKLWLDPALNSSFATLLLWHCVSHWTPLKLRFFACKTSFQDCEN